MSAARVPEPAVHGRAIAAPGPEPRRRLACGGESFARLLRRSQEWFRMCRARALVFVHDIRPEFATATGHPAAGAGQRLVMKFDEAQRPSARA